MRHIDNHIGTIKASDKYCKKCMWISISEERSDFCHKCNNRLKYVPPHWTAGGI